MSSASSWRWLRWCAAAAVAALALIAINACPPELATKKCSADADCPSCTSCDTDLGLCYLSNVCPGGSCRGEACCTGCWQGDTCIEGTALDACGRAGSDCAGCDPSGACDNGACIPPPVSDVALTDNATCAVRHDGTVWCFGESNFPQLGNGMWNGASAYPRQVLRADRPAALTGIEAVDGSDVVFCGRDGAGAIWCWGDGSGGQLGNGSDADAARAGAVLSAASAPALDGFGQFEVGAYHACGLRGDGEVWCWGSNDAGQLGQGDGAETRSWFPLAMLGPDSVRLQNVTQVAVGDRFTCALRADQTVWCVGNGGYGQLGNGTWDSHTLPVEVMTSSSGALAGVVQVACGTLTSCARTQDGLIYCWGRGEEGQLGTGSRASSTYAVPLTDLQGVTDLAVGHDFACATLQDHSVWCWGKNGSAQLGDGTTLDRTRPARALFDPASGHALSIALGRSHSAVLLDNGVIWGWGSNSRGQLGVPITLQTQVVVPQAIPALPSSHCTPQPVRSFGVGGAFACAAESSEAGRLWCWGINSNDELGTGLGGYQAWTSQPVVASAWGGPQSAGFRKVAAGFESRHACGLTVAGTVWCWGYGYSGQLGDGNNYHGTDTPVQVAISDGVPLTGASDVAVGESHSCAALEDGRAMCWGFNDFAQLGNGQSGTNVAWAQPVLLDASTSLSHVSAVAAGHNHSCALLDTGQVRCWGESGTGETGSGSDDTALFAVAVVDAAAQPIDQVTQISAGDKFACAVKVDGSLWCWGANGTGQLGDGGSTNRLSAVRSASSIETVTEVACGGVHACAVSAAGGLWCWGGNAYGQIGNGTTFNQLVPVPAIDDATGAPLVAVAHVRAGSDFTCGTDSAGALWCWGSNSYGQLGRAPDPAVYLRAQTVAVGCP